MTRACHLRSHHIFHWLQHCREDVRKDPVFRAQFHTMCANVGVDPLASNKGMWAQLLGFGDFYYELGVQVVEACLATRSMNGGLMDLDSLRASVTVSYQHLPEPSMFSGKNMQRGDAMLHLTQSHAESLCNRGARFFFSLACSQAYMPPARKAERASCTEEKGFKS